MTAKVPDSFNLSDLYQGHGAFTQAVVISCKDPKKQGRVLCRILGTQDDQGKIPDQKLAWIPAAQAGAAFRGVGEFPPNLRVGSKVILGAIGGQQNQCIIGCLPNQADQKQQRDQHPFVTGENPDLYNALGNTAEKRITGSLTSPAGQKRTTEQAYKGLGGLFGEAIAIFTGNNPLSAIIKTAKIPDIYGGRLAAKAADLISTGSFKYAGDLLNAQTFMKSVGSQELIPNAVSMLESLKATATSGLKIPPIQAVGGLQNILGAISGIAALVKQEQDRDDKKDEKQAQEEFLRMLYKQITGKEPLDEFGKETVKYIKWKQAYLNGELLYE